MKKILLLKLIVISHLSCAQVGGPCEGCEAALEYDPNTLSYIDTLPGFESNKPQIKISGVVYRKDGKTPASNIILYIYHTNRAGIYPAASESKGWERRHGIHRGWVKTNANGQYIFYTFRPASYPNRDEPQHIHLTVKEPGIVPYYLEDFLFDDDPLLTTAKRRNLSHRGGNGIKKTNRIIEGMIHIERDIILGLNIPNYED